MSNPKLNISPVTPEDVAQWMFAELQRVTYLYQEQAVFDIEQKFGEAFVYINENGNAAIVRPDEGRLVRDAPSRILRPPGPQFGVLKIGGPVHTRSLCNRASSSPFPLR